jgi:hypothetical protein
MSFSSPEIDARLTITFLLKMHLDQFAGEIDKKRVSEAEMTVLSV